MLCLLAAKCLTASGQSKNAVPDQIPGSTPATKQILASYEGQKVSSIEIAGRPGLDTAQFTSLFVQQAGQPYAKAKVDQTVAALTTAGKFEAVRVEAQPEPDGVRILLVLEPAVYFGIFEFPGAERFAYSQLLQTANYPVQTPFNNADVKQDSESLVTFFRQAGYFTVEVQPEVKVDAVHAIANVAFHVKLGRRAEFGAVDLEGAPADEDARLKRKLMTLLARARGAAIIEGKAYRRSALNKAARYLQSTLVKQGFLGAQVKLAGAEYHADTNRADIQFKITRGDKTHVEIAGAHVWGRTQKNLLPVYQGIGVDQEAVQEGQQALISYFQAKGFFDVKVDSQLSDTTGSDTVVYRITKGQKHKVTDVSVSGNEHLRDSELMPSMTVQTKQWFSPGKYSDQLVRSSVNNLKAVYESEGFSSVDVTPAVTRRNGNVQVAFRVKEGPRDIVNSLTIRGANTLPQSKFAPDGLKLAAGAPYSQAHVEADRTTIVAHYLQAGYLNASFHEIATEVSRQEPHRINVVYRIYEGPKVTAGELITLGRLHTQQRLVDEDAGSLQTGRPLTETDLLTAGSRLYDHIGVFDWAEVDPKREVTTQTHEDVLVKVHEAKRNDFTYGFGFELIERGGNIPSGTVALPGLPPVGLPSNFTASQATFYGPRGTVQYTRNNLRGKGESLSMTAFAGRLDQRGAIYYIDPNFRWSPWRMTLSGSFERNEENPIFSSQIGLGSLQLQRAVDRFKKDIFFARYSFSKTDLTRILIPDLVPEEDQHVRLSTLAVNMTRDTRDNVLDAHSGVLRTAEIDFNAKKLGASVDFAKLTAQAAYYKEKFHHIVWANSIRIGIARPFNGSFVPLSEEFFSGGGSTLRGFSLDGAGPQRKVEVCPDGTSGCNTFILVPSGGNELFILNSEARIPVPFKKGLSIVPFYDGGNVFPTAGLYHFTSLYSNNAGLGLRYSTPVGPIRFDLGRNLNPITGVKNTQYFISIGQAF
ncbi:MAG TPA: POTRA domain-containing protein [Terracidiphilus sp.]|nr:POTRA domain-containing protein [Terracidiphilus sp.]